MWNEEERLSESAAWEAVEDGIVIYDNQKWIQKIRYDALKDELLALKANIDLRVASLSGELLADNSALVRELEVLKLEKAELCELVLKHEDTITDLQIERNALKADIDRRVAILNKDLLSENLALAKELEEMKFCYDDLHKYAEEKSKSLDHEIKSVLWHHEELKKANQRIKELVEESNKQMHRGDDLQVSLSLAYDDMTAMSEREQRLLTAMHDLNCGMSIREETDPKYEDCHLMSVDKDDYLLFRAALKANKGGA